MDRPQIARLISCCAACAIAQRQTLPYCGVVTAVEIFELTTKGGATDLACVIGVCESFGPYCLIGGLAVNCYVEPVYTLDADIVPVAENLDKISRALQADGFGLQAHEHPVNAKHPGSDLRIQFTKDPRYQPFVERAEEREVLGIRARVATLEDVVQGKLWAYCDSRRRLSKRKKDELDLIRLVEKYPRLRRMYPADLLKQLGEP
jgi:hypothetical protein